MLSWLALIIWYLKWTIVIRKAETITYNQKMNFDLLRYHYAPSVTYHPVCRDPTDGPDGSCESSLQGAIVTHGERMVRVYLPLFKLLKRRVRYHDASASQLNARARKVQRGEQGKAVPAADSGNVLQRGSGYYGKQPSQEQNHNGNYNRCDDDRPYGAVLP